MEIKSFSHAGAMHGFDDTMNQDCCVAYMVGERVGIGLADGAGSKSLSKVGAETLTMEVVQYILNHFDELYVSNEEDFCYNITRKIVFCLDEMSRMHKRKRDEFGSTLMSICIWQNKYIAIHLGDGVIGCSIDDGINIISYPQNGIEKNSTYLTTGTDIHKHLRFYRGEVDSIKNFFLMTDGFAEKCFDSRNINEECEQDIKRANLIGLMSRFEKMDFRDDYSFQSLICGR